MESSFRFVAKVVVYLSAVITLVIAGFNLAGVNASEIPSQISGIGKQTNIIQIALLLALPLICYFWDQNRKLKANFKAAQLDAQRLATQHINGLRFGHEIAHSLRDFQLMLYNRQLSSMFLIEEQGNVGSLNEYVRQTKSEIYSKAGALIGSYLEDLKYAVEGCLSLVGIDEGISVAFILIQTPHINYRGNDSSSDPPLGKIKASLFNTNMAFAKDISSQRKAGKKRAESVALEKCTTLTKVIENEKCYVTNSLKEDRKDQQYASLPALYEEELCFGAKFVFPVWHRCMKNQDVKCYVGFLTLLSKNEPKNAIFCDSVEKPVYQLVAACADSIAAVSFQVRATVERIEEASLNHEGAILRKRRETDKEPDHAP